MVRRVTGTVCWFAGMWSLGAMASFALGGPDWLGPLIGIICGVFILTDPLGLFWPSSAQRRLIAPTVNTLSDFRERAS